MHLRQHFLDSFSQLQDNYQSLKKLAEYDLLRTINNAKSTDSIKKTSRTGCSQIVSQPSHLAEPVQTHFIEQTFCGVENLETSNMNIFGNMLFKIQFDGYKHCVSMPSYESFEHLIREIEQAMGRTLSERGISNIIQAIRKKGVRNEVQNEKKHNIQISERAQVSISPSKTPRKKVKPQQATVTRLNRKMVLQYAASTINQDVDMFCITHKLPARANKQIKKGLAKGQRTINLSE